MFLSIYTPTYQRPSGLAACLASVTAQTAADDLEQVVIPDHIGRGIGGMYAAIPQYADALHGDYIYILADDDVLAGPDVVAEVRQAVRQHGSPAVVIVKAQKGGATWPVGQVWPPVCGEIDLGCLIVRADIWKAHVHQYGHRYEGDYDFAHAIATVATQTGVLILPTLFARGAVSRGEPEV